MQTPIISGVARELLHARRRLDQEELRRLQESNALVVDDRRRRPLYFDGRFLAARDLTREQNYFLTRQSDLGRAGGTGVVRGLMVTMPDEGRRLRIEAGHGITPSGESVVLPEPLTLSLTAIPEMQRLDAAFGLLRRPAEPARSRTGLFIVALRPVEFSANPVASYPTTITEKRSVEDGDIVEGVVATLIPYPDPGGDGELTRRRARTARTLFVEGSTGGFPVDALPLAMVALERNTVRWLDPFLVRREVGAEHGDVLGLGLAPRALREAYVLQYERHLADVLRDRESSNRGRRFAASEHFLALPPGGRMPAQAINPADFTQVFFPPEVTVDLSIIPEDEVPALIEESLLLPPIDLSLGAEALASTAVLVLIPLPVARVRTLRASLERLMRPLASAAPGLLAQRRPLDILRGIQLARLPAPVLRPESLADAAWAAEIGVAASSGDGLLWYVRRRNIDYRSDVVGISVRVAADESEVAARTADNIRDLGLEESVETLRGAATPLGRAELEPLLASRVFIESPLLARAMVRELEAVREEAPAPPEGGEAERPVDRFAVLRVAERFADPQLGEGLKRLEGASPELVSTPGVAESLVASGRAPEVDRVARTISEEQLPEFTAALREAAVSGDPARIDAVLTRATITAPVFRPGRGRIP